ncbi:EamA family transporter RarD [Phytomonospora sp. NPDC050363]|uniref:EamA family transporter RarD n=1 Tax=Phytomonospora sp. NPDC050363 TaxID=3155642 RepID=UPI0033E7736E
MNDSRRGYVFAFAAYGLWGLVPLYWKLLRPAGAVEILGHRILWSVVFTGLVLLAMHWRAGRRDPLNGPGALVTLLRDRRKLFGVAVAATVITVNWGVYIYGVNADRVVETSLGYFINPLVSVALGVLLFRERLRSWQWAAVAVGALAVGVLTVAYGQPPWIALILAFSFAAYGAVKKRLGLPPAESLFVESAFMALPALGFVVWLEAAGQGTFASISVAQALLLAGAGVVTAVPLLFFGAAANRLPLSVMGMIQYVGPVLQFVFGVTVFGEEMPPARWIGFGLVWAALVLFSFDGLRRSRQTRLAGRAAPEALPVTAPVSR